MAMDGNGVIGGHFYIFFQYFTLPHASLWNPGKLHGVHVDSTWIPGKMSQKGNFRSRMHGIHPHSRFIPCRVQKEVFSDYLHGIHMDSSWIPGNIIQKKKSKKIQKKSKKILWPQCIRIMISCYAKMKSVANISLVNNQWPLMYNACH